MFFVLRHSRTDIFKDIKDKNVLTNLNKVQIMRSNFGVGPDWLLDKVKIESLVFFLSLVVALRWLLTVLLKTMLEDNSQSHI